MWYGISYSTPQTVSTVSMIASTWGKPGKIYVTVGSNVDPRLNPKCDGDFTNMS